METKRTIAQLRRAFKKLQPKWQLIAPLWRNRAATFRTHTIDVCSVRTQVSDYSATYCPEHISHGCNLWRRKLPPSSWRRWLPLDKKAGAAGCRWTKKRDHSHLSDFFLLKWHLASHAANTCACNLRSPFCGCSATTPTSSPNRARSRPPLLLRRQGAPLCSLQPRLVGVRLNSSSCQRRRWLPKMR